jgi:LAO/AO transport system kinase
MPRTSDPAVLLPAAKQGDRRALARLLSIVEDQGEGAHLVLAETYREGGTAWTTGLTGAPGAGKSTLTDGLITHLRRSGREVAVLAVDPSSPFSGGATLGDRVRMQNHIDDAGVYIRSMSSRGHLGGIAEATPRLLTVLDGMGFPELLVETVGVGQSEVEVAAAADTTLVVLNPGWGDSIQAAKAGLLEVGDVFVINKADRPGVEDTIRDLRQMLELGPPSPWQPPILTTMASTGEGVQTVAEAIHDHRSHLEESGQVSDLREKRLLTHVRAALSGALHSQIQTVLGGPAWERIQASVLARSLDPWAAARRLLDLTNSSGTEVS